MDSAKDIILKIIPANIAKSFIKREHYSNKVTANSSLHFGAFLKGELHGVMSFGSPLDKRKVLHLVNTSKGVPCLWNEMLELNRMAFDYKLPKNSESRCLSIAFMLIKKNAPHIKWVLSFADALQCGDGTIYRAAGFSLIGIKKYTDFWELPDGNVVLGAVMRMNKAYTGWLRPFITEEKWNDLSGGGCRSDVVMQYIGAKKLDNGYSLKYIYLVDKSCKITVPILNKSDIDKIGAGMYKGKKVLVSDRSKRVSSIGNDAATDQVAEGGAIPTDTLQQSNNL